MKLAIVSPGIYPVPPVEGGAIENLIQNIVDINEDKGKFIIDVYGINSPQIDLTYNKYLTNYCYVNTNTMSYKVSKIIRYLINKYIPFYIGNAYIDSVKKMLQNREYDAILIENRPEYGLILNKVNDAQMVLHLHNDHFNLETRRKKKIFESYDLILPVSDYIGSRVSEIQASSKIKTLYNGIEPVKVEKVDLEAVEKLKKRFNINAYNKVVLYTGRITPGKGVKELILAFVNVLKKCNNTMLLIAGSPISGKDASSKYYDEVVNLSSKYKERIIFTGYIAYENLNQLYAISDISVVPSIGTEAAPLTVLEAQSAGKPVIASDSGGIPELMTNQTGIIVKRDDKYIQSLANALESLLTNDDLVLQYGKRGQAYVEKFSKGNFYDNLGRLLSEVK